MAEREWYVKGRRAQRKAGRLQEKKREKRRKRDAEKAQHRAFPRGPPPQYYPGSDLLNFADCSDRGSGEPGRLIWPALSLKEEKQFDMTSPSLLRTPLCRPLRLGRLVIKTCPLILLCMGTRSTFGEYGGCSSAAERARQVFGRSPCRPVRVRPSHITRAVLASRAPLGRRPSVTLVRRDDPTGKAKSAEPWGHQRWRD